VTGRAPHLGGASSEIRFPSGEPAALVVGRRGADPHALLAALGLEVGDGRPLLVVCGGADELQGEALARAEPVLGPSVAAAAELTGAAVVDGGTAAGVMKLTGAARADRGRALPVLLGVAPAGRVALPDTGTPPAEGLVELEQHHTHFVLADSTEWGGETSLLFDLAGALAGEASVVTVLAGGGEVARAEALETVRRRWPLFVIERTGGTADTIADLWRTYREPGRRRPPEASSIADPALREIVRDGDVRRFEGAEPGQLARRLAWELQDEPVLKAAWRTFATYDALAKGLRRSFERMQAWILALGILGTLVALLHEELGTSVLHWAAVAAPLVVSTLIAVAGRRAAGKRWVLLRAAAESVKAEIFRYRTGTGVYNETLLPDRDLAARPRVLAKQLGEIESRLIHTEASSGVLTPYDGPLPPEMYGAGRDDDGLSALDAAAYIRIRVADQLAYYHGRIRRLAGRRGVLQLLAIAGGGVGAILAAAGLEIWIALTTTISAAALSYLASLQVENTIVAYNQSAGRLASLEREWSARGPAPSDPAAVDRLVTRSEAVLATELGGWVQQMNEALEELQARQAEATRRVQDDQASAGRA
jgi:TRPM family ion channel/conflict system pore-forming effector with SLATT domain/uncharacterized protein DUF4231